jgi:hypothetical protein
MVTTIDYITMAIQTVFKRDDLADAQACLTRGSTPTILSCLDEACSCSFSALANLRNDPPPQAVAISIGADITAAGGEVPSDIALQNKVGDSNIQIGTLRSFYSCTSLSDTSPTLIATGSSTDRGTLLGMKQCNNWAVEKSIYNVNSKFSIDSSIANTYISTTGESGSCFNLIGSMFTQPTHIVDDSGNFYGIIGSAPITCDSDANACSTEILLLTPASDVSTKVFIAEPLTVTCSDNDCTTASTTFYCLKTFQYSCSHSIDLASLGWPASIYDTVVFPAIAITQIGSTAGSLAAFCNYWLDH